MKVLGPAGAIRDLRRLAAVTRALLSRDGSDERGRELSRVLAEYKP